MDAPLVSAVVVTHNRLDLLECAVRSVRSQTYGNVELIVVDDASTDGTRERFESDPGLCDRYLRIPPEESRGGNHARNVGVQAARGDWVALLDDDDEWLPEKIEKQVERALAHPECGVIGCARIMEYDFKWRVTPNPADELPVGWLNDAILTCMPYTTSCLMLKRELVLRVGGFDEGLSHWQDYELQIRLLQESPVEAVQEPLVLYRLVSSDKQRLSNQLAKWERAVIFIEDKHEALIRSASPQAQLAHLAMIANDGAIRAEKAGDSRAKRAYLSLLCELQPTRRNQLRKVLNRTRLKPRFVQRFGMQ